MFDPSPKLEITQLIQCPRDTTQKTCPDTDLKYSILRRFLPTEKYLAVGAIGSVGSLYYHAQWCGAGGMFSDVNPNRKFLFAATSFRRVSSLPSVGTMYQTSTRDSQMDKTRLETPSDFDSSVSDS